MAPRSDWGPTVDRKLLSGADNEDELEAEIEMIERLVDAAVGSVISLDGAGYVGFADEGVRSLLGYDPDRVVGSSVQELLASQSVVDELFDVTSASAFRERVLGGGEVSDLTVPLESVDGTVVPVSLSTVAVENRCVVCLLQETESHEHERAFAHRVVDSANDPIYAVDPSGTVRWANKAMGRYVGYDREELLGRPIRELVPDAESGQQTGGGLELAGRDQQARTIETALVTSTGESILSEVSIAPLTGEGDEYAGSVGVLRDITERTERERQLELLKKMLTRVFRHNVRNELTVIQGHAELVRLADNNEIADHGDAIIESARRLFDHSEKARLIERVLETETLDRKNIAREARAAVTSVTWNHSDTDIDVDLPEEVVVEAHPEIRKAIEELVENAIIHTPPDQQPSVAVWLEEDDQTVRLCVEDNAGGLADHEFEVLQTGKESDLEHGSGVGLWLVRWLAESSDAELLVDPVDGGTLMSIQFHRPDGSP